MFASSVISTVVSAASWAAVFAGLWRSWAPAWAAMSGVIAALCWVNLWRQKHDLERAALSADRSLLLRTLAGVVTPRQQPARTTALHRVR